MARSFYKRCLESIALLGLATSLSCKYTKQHDPDILHGHGSISNYSTKVLENVGGEVKADGKINVDIITSGTLPIYSGERFEEQTIGRYNLLKYHARNVSAKDLKGILDDQLSGIADKINYITETNQILIRTPITSGERVNYEIRDILNNVDVQPAQVMLEIDMYKIFADYNSDLNSFLRVTPKDTKGVNADILSSIVGAELRLPQRSAESGLGIQYGIIGEVGKYLVELKLDNLQSQGIANDLAKPRVLVSSGKTATVNLSQEVPYKDEVLQGGALLALTKYKEIKNYVTVTPEVRDGGNIYLNIEMGVGSLNTTGFLPVPGITSREIKIGGVLIPENQTLVLGGFRLDHEAGTEKEDSFFGNIPILKKILPHAFLKEKSTDQILYMITPRYANVNKR